MYSPHQLSGYVLLSSCIALLLVPLQRQFADNQRNDYRKPEIRVSLPLHNPSPTQGLSAEVNPAFQSIKTNPIKQHRRNLSQPEPAQAQFDSSDNFRIASAKDIPFPLYPNGRRYRIGGKDGMKIALFETSDDFSEVDAYYDRQARQSGLSRKAMTDDYVQYLQPGPDETAALSGNAAAASPGIVIHEFFGADEATKLGAAADSRTNIIISYR